MGRATLLAIPMLYVVYVGIALLSSTLPAQAAEPTTEVQVVKYASDGTTILDNTTVTCGWMEANLPVQGDGVTHYFHQGPMFGDMFEEDPWDVNETTNIEGRDFGAVKGTDVRDLCELVDGMSPGERIMIRASDGFKKHFGYANVYDPEPRQGPMVMTWWRADDGYVPDYSTGMRLVFFADDHVFGHWDMHECIAPEYWYNYTDRDGGHPSSGGLSVKNVDEIAIYSMMDPPELRSIEVSPASLTPDVGYEQQFMAAGYNQYGDEIPGIVFTWTSSDETVGTIEDTGLFAALAAGGTAITARNGSVTGTADVTVTSPAPASTPTQTPTPGPTPTPTPVLTTVTVSPARATLNVGETQQFTAAAYDQDDREIPGVDFVWTSGNATVGTVNRAGVFAAVSAGKAVVRAGAGGVAGVADVIVASTEPAPTETPTAVLSTPTPASTRSPSPALSLHSPPNSPSGTPPKLKPTPESPGFGGLLVVVVVVAVSGIIRRRVV